MPVSLRASVVVPTYNRPDFLERCLLALANQTFAPGEYEVIVADDAASEETRNQVARISKRFGMTGPCLHYLPVRGTQGPAGARNAGWRVAQGDAIAFTDDDCCPQSTWLAAGVEAIEAGADAATGRVVVPLPTCRPTDYERDAAGLADAEFVTANCFCRRTALAAIGGFDARFTAAWREDSDLQFTLLEHGSHIATVPEAVVIHPVRPAPWGTSLKQQRKSQFNALLFKKHPDLYRKRIQSSPPVNYYAAVGSLAVLALGGAFRRPAVALGGAAMWTTITAAFCGRRLQGTSRQPSHVAEMVVTSAVIPALSVYWRVRGALRFRVFFL
jgi:GT2 family glycosyltransferase